MRSREFQQGAAVPFLENGHTIAGCIDPRPPHPPLVNPILRMQLTFQGDAIYNHLKNSATAYLAHARNYSGMPKKRTCMFPNQINGRRLFAPSACDELAMRGGCRPHQGHRRTRCTPSNGLSVFAMQSKAQNNKWGENPFFHPLRHQGKFSYGALGTDGRALPWVLLAKKFC